MIEIIGSKKRRHRGGKQPAERCWKLEEIGKSFCFSSPFCDELYLEYNELAAIGKAYENNTVWHLMDVLNSLEKLLPGFTRIIISDKISLIRKRQADSPALIVEIDGRKVNILKEPTLAVLNFLDFYEDDLKPHFKGKHEQNITGDKEVSSLDLRSARSVSA